MLIYKIANTTYVIARPRASARGCGNLHIHGFVD